MSSKITPANCPFCNPNILETQFAESLNFRAIYNVSPILPGHSLIIPKQHYESAMDLSDEYLCELMIFSRRVIKILFNVFKINAFNWTIQEGEEAGQTVPHLHLHLIPREPKDLPEPGDWYPLLKKSQIEVIDSELREKLTSEQMRKIITHLRQAVKEMDAELSKIS